MNVCPPNAQPIRSQFLPLVFSCLHELGAHTQADSIRKQFDLPEPRPSLLNELTVPLATHRAITEMATHAAQDDFFGIRVAEYCPRGHFGLVELAARYAPNLGQALKRLTRYVRLLTETETLRLEMRPAGNVALVHEIHGEPLCLGRQANEFTLSVILRLIRQVARTPAQVRRVEFAHAAPASHAELQREFGTADVQFDAGRNALVFDADVEAIDIASSDEAVLPWLDRHAEMLLPRAAPACTPFDLRETLRAALLASRVPSLPAISSELGHTARTLQRRLAAAGTSFQDELDAVRTELAESYLLDRTRPIQAIAHDLGYADLRGFVRAFTKWKGITPAKFRRLQTAPRPLH